MPNSIKFSLITSAILLFGLSFIVLAQENTPTVASTADENSQFQDLGIENPKILPDNPLYFLKNWVREIQSALTFNRVKKAELKMKFANEKLMELKKMVEQKKNNQQIKKATENYQKGIEGLKTTADKIKEKAEQNVEVGKFLDKFVKQQTLHQQILEKLETKVATTTFEKIQEAREKHLERFSEVMNKLENKEGIQERLEQNLEKTSTSTKETMIKVRDRIMEKVQQRNNQGTTTETCITLWDPVCGKDGKTYSNNCFAKTAGVEVNYKGECKKEEEEISLPPHPEARDLRRFSDLKQVALALNLYYQKHGFYPAWEGPSISEAISSYLWPVFPKDPINKSEYVYHWINNNANKQKYCVWVSLEVASEGQRYFAISERGESVLETAPTDLSCW